MFEFIACVPISEILEVKEAPLVSCENGFSVVIQKETWSVKTDAEKERTLWLLELMKWVIIGNGVGVIFLENCIGTR
jgi:hypothetical protein